MGLTQDLTLAPFAPVLQFWAGVCLLFTYDELLKKAPLAKQVESIKRHFEKSMQSCQGYLDDEKFETGKRHISNLQSFSTTFLQRITWTSLAYSCALLVLCGLEDSVTNAYLPLALTSAACVTSSVLFWIIPNTSHYISRIIAIAFSAMIIATYLSYGNICDIFHKGVSILGMEQNVSVILSIATAFIPFILYIVYIFVQGIKLGKTEKKAQEAHVIIDDCINLALQSKRPKDCCQVVQDAIGQEAVKQEQLPQGASLESCIIEIMDKTFDVFLPKKNRIKTIFVNLWKKIKAWIHKKTA